MCYDIVLFDGKPCTTAHHDRLKGKANRVYIKSLIDGLANYEYIEGRPEKQILFGLKDAFRLLMEKELKDGENAEYDPFLTPLLKNMLNEIYADLGVGKHVVKTYKIFSNLGFIPDGYEILDKDIQDEYFFNKVIRKLKAKVQSTVEYRLKTLDKKANGLSVYKGATRNGKALNQAQDALYNKIREEEKKKITDYRYLSYLTNARINEKLISLNKEPQTFYYNWIVDIEPNFQLFNITVDLNECRRQLNENFLLKLKKDIGYKELAEFLDTVEYQQIRNQIENDNMNFMEYGENPKIESGAYIPDRLKKHLVFGEHKGTIFYYDIYSLGSYIHDINIIIKRAML